MSRQQDPEGRDRAWRDLAWAGAGAVIVTLLLVASVGLIWVWLIGQAPADAPALGAPIPPTPTPRALSFVRATPPPTPPAEIPTATAIISVEAAEEPAAAAATPELPATSPESDAAPASDVAIFEAPGDVELKALASGSWDASRDALRNGGNNAVAEPWLKLATAPNAAFAVEAEIRVNRLLDSVCDQSFGLVGGNPAAGQMYGGGVLFPCSSDAPSARLTDVAVWQDGYNADTVVAEDAFDPGEGWHTYRFELRGNRLRLIVDGVGIVSGPPPVAVDTAAPNAEAGIWAQGVELEVRRVAVYPLSSG